MNRQKVIFQLEGVLSKNCTCLVTSTHTEGENERDDIAAKGWFILTLLLLLHPLFP